MTAAVVLLCGAAVLVGVLLVGGDDSAPSGQVTQGEQTTSGPTSTTPSPQATTSPQGRVTLYVTPSASANLRAQPTTDSEVREVLPQGTAVQAAENTVEGDGGRQWYRVSFDSAQGYVETSLLDNQDPTAGDSAPG